MLHLWYAPIYTGGLSPEARFPRERYRLVRAGLENLHLAGAVRFREPGFIEKEVIDLAHCPEYSRRFYDGELSEKEIRRIGLKPWTVYMVERTRMLTEGTVAATRHVLEHGGMAGNLAGGTHHAYRNFGSGYCIFNDLAIAALVAIRYHGIRQVLILDLDVHQGDGTAAIFEPRAEEVRTVSFHCEANFPFRKMRSDVDVALPEGMGDAAYLERLAGFLDAEAERFEPELILYQAGVDVLATDRLGKLAISRAGVAKRNELVFEFARRFGVPLVVTMGGGYGVPIETSCAAHVDLFSAAAGY